MSAHNGITFTEFTYQLLQGYDFYELFRTMGCTVQVGGSDQWGNILSGIDLINKVEGDCAGYNEGCFALTTPLLTTSQGEKFGKSAGNAVWLDEKLTSYLDFYQVCWLTITGHQLNSSGSSSFVQRTLMLRSTSRCLLYFLSKK